MDAQREQSATTRCEMSSGRRSEAKILAFANTSLGRRQTTPANSCSGDNSSSPSGSLCYQRRQSASKNFGPVFRFLRNKVSIYLNNVPVPVPAGAPRPGEGVVHRGTATPLITDPFFNTRCCSSAISPSYR